MNKVHKIIFIISLCLVILCILSVAIELFLPIEITNETVKMNFLRIRLLGFPIVVFITLIGSIKQKNTIWVVIIKSLTAIIFTGIYLLIMAILTIGNSRRCTESEVLYNHKQKQNTQIIGRYTDYRAYPEYYEPFKITKLSDNFIWAVKVDTTNLDTNKWEKVVNTKIAE